MGVGLVQPRLIEHEQRCNRHVMGSRGFIMRMRINHALLWPRSSLCAWCFVWLVNLRSGL